MKKKIWSIICFLGLPWLIVLFILGMLAKENIIGESLHNSFTSTIALEDFSFALIITLIGWIVIVLRNTYWLGTDKEYTPFTWLEKWEYSPQLYSERKLKSQYPSVDKEYLSDTPDGLVLGWWKNKYVRVPIGKGNILNAVILGSAGCGKSVLLLTMLLYQLNKVPMSKEPMVFYCTDIKPELARKSVKIKGNSHVRVIDPHDRNSFGWDVYYRLSPDSDDDDIMREMDLICRALIDCSNNEKNIFFYYSAQNVAKGVLFYTYKNGYCFMDAMDYLTDRCLAEVLAEILERIKGKPEYQMVYALLSPYAGKTGETIESIELTLRESLAVFRTNAVHYFLDSNPNKTSPLDLERRISIFFSLKESRLEEYRCLVRLITMQIMNHCTERPETAHMLTLIVDEASRLGIDYWPEFLATSRSRQISTILAFQSIGQAYDKWGPEKTTTLLELCRVISVLSCTDPDMAKMLSEWIGDYKERRIQTNNNSGYSLSYDDKKILQPSDIMNLQDMKEALHFIKGKYYRTDVFKARYYNIPQLNEISEECVRYNEDGKDTV